MGLNYNDVRCLLEWRKTHPDGTSVLTIGRQGVYLHPRNVAALERIFAGDNDLKEWLRGYRWGDYADEMFKSALHFRRVESLDISSFEGATITQDIGVPLARDLVGQFDLVVDGGTLEHVFNFPVAIGNLMNAARVGGFVYTQNPCNAQAGHGFYQFSPELMYRVFSEGNGFKVHYVRIAFSKTISPELTEVQPLYDVIDPRQYGDRVYLMKGGPASMLCLAEKTENQEPFTRPTLQSDYEKKWQGPIGGGLNWKGKIAALFPVLHRRLSDRSASPSNHRAYRRVW